MFQFNPSNSDEGIQLNFTPIPYHSNRISQLKSSIYVTAKGGAIEDLEFSIKGVMGEEMEIEMHQLIVLT